MSEQTERITYFENIYDRLSAALRQVNDSLNVLQALHPLAEELNAYYTGRDWKKDFADDEAGLLPAALKRGVLSEDGISDLLDEIQTVCEKNEYGTAAADGGN